MNAKVEVLSVKYQFPRRNSRINDESFHEGFQVQNISKVRMETHMKNTISLSIPIRRHIFNPRERKILTAWSKHVSSEGGLL